VAIWFKMPVLFPRAAARSSADPAADDEARRGRAWATPSDCQVSLRRWVLNLPQLKGSPPVEMAARQGMRCPPRRIWTWPANLAQPSKTAITTRAI